MSAHGIPPSLTSRMIHEGLACPECGDRHSAVLETDIMMAGIRRHRVCVNGHRYNTREWNGPAPLPAFDPMSNFDPAI